MREMAAQRRRPRIPSYLLHLLNQQPPRHARLKGAALISPHADHVNTDLGAIRAERSGAQQPVNLIVIIRHVQGIIAKNYRRSDQA